MAVHIARGEESSAANPVLDIWVLDPATGLLVEPFALSFKVSALSTGAPVEVQPWTPVNLVADLVQLGRYAAAWTPPAVDPVPANGRHEIRWRAQLLDGGPVREIRELFDVLEGEVVFAYPEPYALVSDLRAEGETGSDYALLEALHEASRLVERITGRTFVPAWRARLPVVGGDTKVLRIDDPIISMESIERNFYADGSPELIERTQYVAFNRHITHGLTSDDDRADPRIELVDYGYPLGVAYRGRAYYPQVTEDFIAGGQRYLLTGLFGYTDPDGRSFVGVTPRGIVEATKRIAIAMLAPLGGADGSVAGGGGGAKIVKSEKTRDQSVDYDTGSNMQSKVGSGALGELTGDAVTDQILARYVRQRAWAV